MVAKINWWKIVAAQGWFQHSTSELQQIHSHNTGAEPGYPCCTVPMQYICHLNGIKKNSVHLSCVPYDIEKPSSGTDSTVLGPTAFQPVPDYETNTGTVPAPEFEQIRYRYRTVYDFAWD